MSRSSLFLLLVSVEGACVSSLVTVLLLYSTAYLPRRSYGYTVIRVRCSIPAPRPPVTCPTPG
eukprot:6058577-Prymnesium_polylepis.1